jgi:hypothetical protein
MTHVMCEDLHEHKFIGLAFGEGPGHIRLHTTLEDPLLVLHFMVLEVSWGQLLDTLFWALIMSWSRSWLVCEVVLNSSLGVVYIMDHEVVPCQRAFFPWSDFYGSISKKITL